jgi:hypothetical protein
MEFLIRGMNLKDEEKRGREGGEKGGGGRGSGEGGRGREREGEGVPAEFFNDFHPPVKFGGNRLRNRIPR